jgi:Glyoxalase/Bleomycin resistance protein/Dioxygenase superfamily
MPRLSPYYHVGIEWGPVMHLPAVDYRNGEGDDLALPTTMCYSVDAPHLELVQEVPGSVWARNEHSNLHHIGVWCDDLPADSAQIASIGCPLQLCGRSGDAAPVSFAYHGHELGIRIELVDAAMQETMAFLFRPEGS